MVGKARRKAAAVSFAECVNQRVAVFLADLTVLVAVSGINCHLVLPTNLETSVAPAFVGAGGLRRSGATGAAGCKGTGRPAYS